MAATTAISGHDGSITGPTGMGEVIDWNANLSTKLLPATSMASAGYEEDILGLKSGEFSGTCQGIVIPAMGLVASVVLKTKSTGGSSITGSANISGVGVKTGADQKVTYDFKGKFTGAFVVA